MLATSLVSLSQLQPGKPGLVKIKSLPQKSLAHFVTNSIRTVNLIIGRSVDFRPLVKVLFQVAFLHDIGPSVQGGSARSINLLLLLINLLRQVLDLGCKIASLLLHFHDHGRLHLDLLRGLANLPSIKGVPQAHLPTPNYHVLHVLIDHDGLPVLHAFPLVEVLGDAAVDHVLDGVDAATAPGAHGLLSFLLDLLADRLDRRIAILLERLLHHDELFLLLADSHRVEAHLQQRAIAVFLKAEHRFACVHHEPLILVGLSPRLHISSQSVQPPSPHLIQVIPERAKGDPFELIFSESSRQDVVAHLLIHSHAEVHPLLERFSQFVRVRFPNEPLAPLTPESGIIHIVFPHLERSLDVFLAVFSLGVPDCFKCLRLGSVHIVCILLPIAP